MAHQSLFWENLVSAGSIGFIIILSWDA